MALKFLKQNEIVDANRMNPLPAEVVGEIETRAVAPLIPHTYFIPNTGITDPNNILVTHADILQSSAAEQPTLAGTGEYRALVVFVAVDAVDTYHYHIFARATNSNGDPLIPTGGWASVKQGSYTPPTGATAPVHFRIDIGLTTPSEAYYDQYRIIVVRHGSGSPNAYAKVIGVR